MVRPEALSLRAVICTLCTLCAICEARHLQRNRSTCGLDCDPNGGVAVCDASTGKFIALNRCLAMRCSGVVTGLKVCDPARQERGGKSRQPKPRRDERVVTDEICGRTCSSVVFAVCDEKGDYVAENVCKAYYCAGFRALAKLSYCSAATPSAAAVSDDDVSSSQASPAATMTTTRPSIVETTPPLSDPSAADVSKSTTPADGPSDAGAVEPPETAVPSTPAPPAPVSEAAEFEAIVATTPARMTTVTAPIGSSASASVAIINTTGAASEMPAVATTVCVTTAIDEPQLEASSPNSMTDIDKPIPSTPTSSPADNDIAPVLSVDLADITVPATTSTAQRPLTWSSANVTTSLLSGRVVDSGPFERRSPSWFTRGMWEYRHAHGPHEPESVHRNENGTVTLSGFEEGEYEDWATAILPAGFGGDFAYLTALNRGLAESRHTMFRTNFCLTPAQLAFLVGSGLNVVLFVASDNHAVVQLNGETLLNEPAYTDHEMSYWNSGVSVPSSVLVSGTNTLAAAVYNSYGSSDAAFDSDLRIVNGPDLSALLSYSSSGCSD